MSILRLTEYFQFNRQEVSYMVVVTKKKGETKDAMFRKFSKIFVEENIVEEVRKKLYYKKPSLVRKEKEKERTQKRSRSY